MDFAAIPRPAFGTAQQHLASTRTKPSKRRTAEAKTASELAALVPTKTGESVHVLMTGNYDLQTVVATVCRESPCLHLRIATLSYSARNAASLIDLLETKAVARLTLIVSKFFRDFNEEQCQSLDEELTRYPGSIQVAVRSHCKIICFERGESDRLVFEGSANLRSNGSTRENITMIRHRGLSEFHSAWIDELVKQNAKEAEEARPAKRTAASRIEEPE